MVRYSPGHYPFDEWVYNAPDIDGAKVIWAREMDAANNLELIRYYKDRNVWLVQPDAQPPQVSAYPIPEQQAVVASTTQLRVTGMNQQIGREIHH